MMRRTAQQQQQHEHQLQRGAGHGRREPQQRVDRLRHVLCTYTPHEHPARQRHEIIR